MFYIGVRSRLPNPTTLRRNPTPRGAHPTHPRTQRPSPSQRPIHGARGSSDRRHLLIPTGSRAPSLIPRRWKDALDRAIADRPSPAETPSRWSVSSELTLYQARGGGPAIPGRDSLSEVGPPASLRHIKQGAVGPPRPSGGPRNIGYLRGPQPDHWPLSCLRAFRGGVKAGLSARAVGAPHRALGRGRLQSALGGPPGPRQPEHRTSIEADRLNRRLPSPPPPQQNNQHPKPHN